MYRLPLSQVTKNKLRSNIYTAKEKYFFIVDELKNIFPYNSDDDLLDLLHIVKDIPYNYLQESDYDNLIRILGFYGGQSALSRKRLHVKLSRYLLSIKRTTLDITTLPQIDYSTIDYIYNRT